LKEEEAEEEEEEEEEKVYSLLPSIHRSSQKQQQQHHMMHITMGQKYDRLIEDARPFLLFRFAEYERRQIQIVWLWQ
jgi:hypothetical protein